MHIHETEDMQSWTLPGELGVHKGTEKIERPKTAAENEEQVSEDERKHPKGERTNPKGQTACGCLVSESRQRTYIHSLNEPQCGR